MRQIILASKDATIYHYFPTNNAGLDEILEIGKSVDELLVEPVYASGSARALLHFSVPASGSVPTGSRYFLNLRIAHAEKLRRSQQIEVMHVTRSWTEGSGYYYQSVQNSEDGVTWNEASPAVSWPAAGVHGDTTVTASFELSTYPLQDIRVDVTDIVAPIVNSGSAFNGLLVKFPTTDEVDNDNEGVVRVFSTQTHTIHQPYLEVGWDSQTFVTGSLVATPSTLDVAVSPTNLKESYYKGDVSRINLTVRDPYPVKTFNAVFRYAGKYYLPTTSYFSIVDVQANTVVVPFDDYSKINCDSAGVYFDLDTSPLYRGRYYTVKIKVVSGSYSKVIPTNLLFKVE